MCHPWVKSHKFYLYSSILNSRGGNGLETNGQLNTAPGVVGAGGKLFG